MNAHATINRDLTSEQVEDRCKRRAVKIIANAEAIFNEAYGHGLTGEFFDAAWEKSQARLRLAQPSKSPMSAIERRDRTLYFFEEGLRAGHTGMPIEYAWKQSYSRVIAVDLAERANLRDG